MPRVKPACSGAADRNGPLPDRPVVLRACGMDACVALAHKRSSGHGREIKVFESVGLPSQDMWVMYSPLFWWVILGWGGTLGKYSRLYREFMDYFCWNMFLRNIYIYIYIPGYSIPYTGHIPWIFFVKMICWQHYKEEAIPECHVNMYLEYCNYLQQLSIYLEY